MKLDPTGTQILYSTFLGGSLSDQIAGIAVDAQGNCIIAEAGYDQSWRIPFADPVSFSIVDS